ALARPAELDRVQRRPALLTRQLLLHPLADEQVAGALREQRDAGGAFGAPAERLGEPRAPSEQGWPPRPRRPPHRPPPPPLPRPVGEGGPARGVLRATPMAPRAREVLCGEGRRPGAGRADRRRVRPPPPSRAQPSERPPCIANARRQRAQAGGVEHPRPGRD